MQVKCWLGFKQVGRTDVHQLTFPRRRLVAALLVPLGLALSACEVGRSPTSAWPADRSSTSISSARWKRQKLATGSCGPSTEGWKPMSCRSVTNSRYSIPRLRPAARLVADRLGDFLAAIKLGAAARDLLG